MSGYDYAMFGASQSNSELRVKVFVSENLVQICYMLQRQKNTIEIIKIKNDGYEVHLRELPGFDINGDITSISMKKVDVYQTIVKAAEFIQLEMA